MLGLRIHEVEQIHGKQVRDDRYFLLFNKMLQPAVDVADVSIAVLTGAANDPGGRHLQDVSTVWLG